jgi:NAD-dependent deacetylase
MKKLVVLTGAGISAESGIPTFRDSNGLWEGFRVEDVASPEGWHKDPALVLDFYNQRRKKALEVKPNKGHEILAELENDFDVTIVTQNVDNLHERAGSKRLVHMHGENCKAWCLACDARSAWQGPMSAGSACPHCGANGALRPDIVWFGEMPYEMDRIEDALRACDLFVSIGTSGAVYPAAGFVQTARYCGARTLEMNLEPSLGSDLFDESRIGSAGELAPEWVRQLLSGG